MANDSWFPVGLSKGQAPTERLFEQPFSDGQDCSIGPEGSRYEFTHTLNLWDRIRDGFLLETIRNKRVQIEIDAYAKRSNNFQLISKNAKPYLYEVVAELEARKMPLELALLPIVESAYDPFAYSHGKASGMWQIVPRTGTMLGLKQNWWYDGRRDVVASTDAALNYLSNLAERFDGDWLLALAAYNGGASKVFKAMRKNKRKGLPTDYWHLDLPNETEAYVPKLLALREIVLNTAVYQAALRPIPNKPHFVNINVNSQLDLALAANMAGITTAELSRLNPGFNRWATDPDGPHFLCIPADKEQQFTLALTKLPSSERVTWERYTVKKGDALSKIAQKYQSSVPLLQAINELPDHKIAIGKVLLVPRASKNSKDKIAKAAKQLRAQQNRAEGEPVDYVVKSGDSLWLIGKKMGVSVRDIARWNRLGAKHTLRPGQKLMVKPKKDLVANKTTTRKVTYKVRQGDSLSYIADKFNVKISEIVHWNRVNKSHYLHPGDRLNLFVDVTNVKQAARVN